jgi:glycosyltransferase involved in cell wall biosynthesis
MNIAILTHSYFERSKKGQITKLITNYLCKEWQNGMVFLFSEAPIPRSSHIPSNLRAEVLPAGGFPLPGRLWRRRNHLKKKLKQHGISTIISFDGDGPELPGIRRWVVIDDPEILTGRQAEKLLEANGILATSSWLKSKLVPEMAGIENKILAFQGLRPESTLPITFDEKLEIRERYTDQKEYFICCDTDLDPGGFVLLLKAFSLFKQRQQSGWKMLICLRSGKNKEALNQSLSTYKYRYDVVLKSPDSTVEITELLAAAYAQITVSESKRYPLEVFEGLTAEIPVIAMPGGPVDDYSDIVLTASAAQPADLAEKMMQIYKDEALREKTIEAGKTRLAEIDPQKIMREMTRGLLQA